MYEIQFSSTYKKSIKRVRKGGKISMSEVDLVINTLASGKSLSLKHRDHKLSGEFSMYRECHIKPDLLLIYQIKNDILVLVLINIGSHSELF